MAISIVHRRGPLPGLNTRSEADRTPWVSMAESVAFIGKVIPESGAIWSHSELSTVNDNASMGNSCSADASDEDSPIDGLADEPCGVPEMPSPPSLRSPGDPFHAELLDPFVSPAMTPQMPSGQHLQEDHGHPDKLDCDIAKAFGNRKNTLILTNLPRTFGASELIRNLADAGYRPVRDFDFLHVPMTPDGMNHGFGVIHLIDESTRSSFISSFQGDDTNSASQRHLTTIRWAPLKESSFEDSGALTACAELHVEDRGNPEWMDARMVQIFKCRPNAVLLYNLNRTIDASDLILELYNIGFHPRRDFDFAHVPLVCDGMNNGYGVINLVDTSTRNAFISLVQSDAGSFGSVMLYSPQIFCETL